LEIKGQPGLHSKTLSQKREEKYQKPEFKPQCQQNKINAILIIAILSDAKLVNNEKLDGCLAMVICKLTKYNLVPKNMLCYLSFHLCDKMPNINNIREKRFIMSHGFRDFSP
jgi:hypothetical protein